MTSIALSFAVITGSAGECGAGPGPHVISADYKKQQPKSYVRGETGLPVFKCTKTESSETRCYRQVLQGR